jgi:ubiquinol-cytochrome c reductase cytochrome c1 subunit
MKSPYHYTTQLTNIIKLNIINMKKILTTLFFITFSVKAFAAGGSSELMYKHWPFEGGLGKVDKQSAQRGLQVYKEVCSGCHSLERVYYRNLEDIGFSKEEIKALAAEYTVTDGPNDDGDMFDRPAKPSDSFVSPFPNENAARAANGGAHPPDLSLITKAREDGPNYVFSLLNGYAEAPRGFHLSPGMHYNLYFHGKQIAMPQPLSDGQVEYMDGTHPSVEQMSYDLVNFLQWAAEPEMETRKKLGLKILIFLLIFTFIFWRIKVMIWKSVR